MSPTDARRAMLRAEIERDWEMALAQLALARTVDPSTGAPQAALVALSLDHAYQAFENVLVRLERALGLPSRTGSDWHRSLLADAALGVAGLRPALFPAEVERDWDELRRFRHFLRHAYPLDLDRPLLAHACAASNSRTRVARGRHIATNAACNSARTSSPRRARRSS